MRKRVLVLGAGGIIGRIVAEDLAGHYDLTLVDLHEATELSRITLDISRDYDSLRRVTSGCDAVLHLACVEETETTHANLQMAKNIYRAALETKPRPRVIVASSIHAVGGYLDWDREPYASIARGEATETMMATARITTAHPPYPNGLYGAMKVYLESLGAFYALQGLEVVAIRFGGVREDDRLVDETGYHAFWLSRRDCVQMIGRAIEARLSNRQPSQAPTHQCRESQSGNDSLSSVLMPPLAGGRFVLVFAVSDNRYRVHDLTAARDVLGFSPKDDSWRWQRRRTR